MFIVAQYVSKHCTAVQRINNALIICDIKNVYLFISDDVLFL